MRFASHYCGVNHVWRECCLTKKLIKCRTAGNQQLNSWACLFPSNFKRTTVETCHVIVSKEAQYKLSKIHISRYLHQNIEFSWSSCYTAIYTEFSFWSFIHVINVQKIIDFTYFCTQHESSFMMDTLSGGNDCWKVWEGETLPKIRYFEMNQ